MVEIARVIKFMYYKNSKNVSFDFCHTEGQFALRRKSLESDGFTVRRYEGNGSEELFKLRSQEADKAFLAMSNENNTME